MKLHLHISRSLWKERILVNYSFPFSDTALHETTHLRERLAALNTLPLVRGITLDPSDSRDLDDAFWVTLQPTGGVLLYVSIANVASFLTPGDTPALDREAFQRGRTLYIAEKVAHPMLPTMLSEDSLSLREGQLRPALTLTIPFDAQFRPGELQIEQTRVLNVRSYSYDEADAARAQPHMETDKMLIMASTLARKLVQHPAPDGVEKEEGATDEQFPSPRIPHAFALLVNQTVADFLAKRSVPALYRSHPGENAASAYGGGTPSRQRSSSTGVRASYCASSEPHTRLGLPVYMHITSPLRRYADVVNQRILLAVLAGRSCPYTLAELQILADHLNEREVQLQEEEQRVLAREQERLVAQLFAVRDEREVQATLEPLDAKTFHEILVVMREKPDLPFPLEQDLIRRIEHHLLPPADLFGCLFRSPHKQEGWLRVKRAVVVALQQRLPLAMTLLSLGRQVLLWDEPTYRESSTGPETARVFWASAELLLDGQEFASNSHSAQHKKRAKQLALLDLLARIAGVYENTLVGIRRDAVLAPLPPTPRGALDNPVAFLNELRQKRLIHTLDYVYQESGPPHERTFSCQCLITLPAIQPIEGNGTGNTKKDATRSAAAHALEAVTRVSEEIAFFEQGKTSAES